jgi:ribosome-binding factor A
MKIKTERINNMLLQEISIILATEVKDRDLNFITVTSVKTSNDLGYAKVYVRLLDTSKKDDVMKALKNASGFVRKNLFDRVEMRHIPQLEFIYDDSIDYGKRIEDIIENLNN